MKIPFADIATNAIKEHFESKPLLDAKSLYETFPKLKEPGATFVTLTYDGNLRGCIGSLEAYRPLLEDLTQNAKAAAFEDPRFYPLSVEEFAKTSIEVSLLSSPALLDYTDVNDLKNKITPFEDGVILKLGSRKSTFLPQVWEQLPDFESFFSHLCQKAGLDENCLEKHPSIYIYKVEKFEK